MTLEAFGTVLSLKHRTHFTQCAEFKFTWFSLRSMFHVFLEDNRPKLSLREGNSCPSFNGIIHHHQLPV